ncbi:MAG TPA: PLP-dependent aminotransferase family protein [Holophagaceae bacterium]|nr:PLP-dependent aminotransferase family protein [Holophagaceae bacterium]
MALPEGGGPLFLTIARALIDDIRKGRLRPGDPLPGYRTLAESLDVSRNTVLAAYQELIAEGWVVSRPGGGSFVADPLPETLPGIASRNAPTAPIGFDLEGPSEPAAHPLRRGREVLAAMSGVPDARLLPMAAMARAYRGAMARIAKEGPVPEDPKGHLRLRTALASMLSSLRGFPADPANLLVSRGSQMALFLIAQALLRPGDRIAVEALGQRRTWEAFERSGARLMPLPVDAEGLVPEALEQLLAQGPLRALYLTPQHQYPTTATLAEPRRARILALAQKHRFAIIEHDYDAEFHYEGHPVMPLAAADRAGCVIFVGTLSKIFTSSVRLGFVHGPRPLIDRLSELRNAVDHQGDPALELALADLMEEGELQRHVHRMRRTYHARRDLLAQALARELGGAISFGVPHGGMAFWIRAADGIDVDAWAVRALDRGVAFRPAREFEFQRRALPFLRLGFTSLREGEIQEAALRLARALEA